MLPLTSQGRTPVSKGMTVTCLSFPPALIPAVLILPTIYTLHSDEQWSLWESDISLFSTLGQFSWPVMTFWYPFVSDFKTASLFTTILSLKVSGLPIALSFSWLLLKIVNFPQQDMWIKRKSVVGSMLQLGLVTLLRFQVWKVLLKSLFWVSHGSGLLYQQRRELDSKSYNSMVNILSSTSQCFQNWQHSPYNSLLNQSALFSHFFISLTFSSHYKNCFQLHFDKPPSVLRPQVLESHGFGFHSISLYCPSTPGTTITLDLSVHGIMNWWCPQKSCQMPPFYKGRNWAQGSPQFNWAHDSQPMFFPL